MAIAAKMPIIATTIISSINVKPFAFKRIIKPSLLSLSLILTSDPLSLPSFYRFKNNLSTFHKNPNNHLPNGVSNFKHGHKHGNNDEPYGHPQENDQNGFNDRS